MRPERPADVEEIREILVAAFEREDEADLVERLRDGTGPFLSLVAEQAGRLEGHILFTEVRIEPECPGLALGLAPMAVRPGAQRGGIGSTLIEAGLRACRAAGARLVVVLGHPDYYPRFGFRRANAFGLSYEMSVPLEAFMVQAFGPRAEVPGGTVRYRPEFGEI